ILTPVNLDGQQESSSVSSQYVTSMLNPTSDADWGSKRRRKCKELESASAPLETATRSAGRSTTGSKSRQVSASESAFAEEPVQTISQMDEPLYPVFETGADDQTIVQSSQHPKWFSQRKKPPTLDRDWNKTLPATEKTIPVAEGSSETTTKGYMKNYKNVSQNIRDQLNVEADAVQIILIGIDNNIYSTVDACPNACEIWKAIERLKQVNEIRAKKLARTANPLALVAQQQPVYHPQNHPTHYTHNSSTRSQQAATRIRGKAIINSPSPIYDQEPTMKINKPTNNNLRTSSNTNRANQNNTPRINKCTRYDNQRVVNVAGARENVGTPVVQKSRIQCYNCKEYGHVARECQKPKRAKGVTYHKEKMLLSKYTKNLEKAKKERDELKLILEKLQNSSKSLNTLLESQVNDNDKTKLRYKAASLAVEGFVNSSIILEKQKNRSDKGYHAVPPPFTGNYMPLKCDLRLIDEHFESVSVDVISNIEPSDVKTIDVNHKDVFSTEEPKPVMKNNFSPPIIEDWHSDDESEVDISPIVEVKIVKPGKEHIEFVKSAREIVTNEESPKQHKHHPRGNQQKWNNLMSQRLGSNFKMINKACYVCGSFEHLQYDCDKRVLYLEKTKTAQAKKIVDLKKRDKKEGFLGLRGFLVLLKLLLLVMVSTAGLQSVEERLGHYKKNAVVLTDKINVLNLEVKLRDNVLAKYTKNLEKAEKERDELKLILEKLQNSSKSLNTLLESQVSDKDKTRLRYKAASPAVEGFVNSSKILEKQKNRSDKGYHAIPLPFTGNYMPPKRDLRLIDEYFERVSVDVISNIVPSDVKIVKTIDVNHKDVFNTEEPKPVEEQLYGEARLKLKELMELYTKLSDRVLDLEKTKTAQSNEIVDLKKRVKKLERKRRSKTLRMNLFKIGTSRRRSLGEDDASKQGRNLKQMSIFEESNFDVQAMMDADYELAARLKAKEQRTKKPLTKA
nr:retrotransposon Orf1 [Tanacetum cinerariifolium]